MDSVTHTLHNKLVESLKQFYARGAGAALDELDRLYTEDVEFRDPICRLHGRLALRRHLRHLYRQCPEINFDYRDQLIGENRACIHWFMRLRHPRLNGGELTEVPGMTRILYTDRIYYHEDYFDMGAMLYRNIPLLGTVIRHIDNRLRS